MRGKQLATPDQIRRHILSGAGQGIEESYNPWLSVRDVRGNSGRSRIVQGMTINRLYHLLSDLEYHFFLNMDFTKEVVDIREQYPLPLEETEKIASHLGVAHPREPRTRHLKVMTTDFLLTVKRPGSDAFYVARSMKYEADLVPGNRSSEKQAIEAEYWRAQSVDWGIVTEKQIEQPLTRNIRYIYGKAKVPLPARLMNAVVINRILQHLSRVDSSKMSLSRLHETISLALSFPKPDVQQIFYWCLWHKYIRAEIHIEAIEPNRPIMITSIHLLADSVGNRYANY
jgi:hypothetical protein